jgi:hypothetical protein
MDTQVKEAFRIPNTHVQKRTCLCLIIVKLPRIQNKEKINTESYKREIPTYLQSKKHPNTIRFLNRNSKGQESLE